MGVEGWWVVVVVVGVVIVGFGFVGVGVGGVFDFFLLVCFSGRGSGV